MSSRYSILAITAAAAALIAVLVFVARDPSRNGHRARSLPRDQAAHGSESTTRQPIDVVEDDAVLRGRTIDQDGVPVPGVRVYAQAPITSERAAAWIHDGMVVGGAPLCRTEDTGSFRLALGTQSAPSLLFLKRGYAPATLVLSEVDWEAGATVVLHAARELRGSVFDTAGRPIENAIVCVGTGEGGTGPSHRTPTDTQGAYALRDLPTTLHGFFAMAHGYKAEFAEVPEPGQRHTFVLSRSGVVIDVRAAPSQQPLEAASATVFTEQGGVVTRGRARGASEAGGFVPGRIVVPTEHLLSPSQRHLRGELETGAPGYTLDRRGISLELGREPPHLQVSLEPNPRGPSVTGTVFADSQARVSLCATPPPGYPLDVARLRVVAQARTDAMGQFRIEAVPAGPYILRVEAPGLVPEVFPLTVPAHGLEIRPSQAASLEVTLQGSSGDPAPQHWCHLEIESSPAFWNQQTNRDGVARFQDLPAGKAIVAPVRWPQVLPAGAGVTLAEVRLTAGERAELTVRLPARHAITVAVRDSSGRGLADAGVTLAALSGYGWLDSKERDRLASIGLATDQGGSASVELFPGRYQVLVSRAGVERQEEVEIPPSRGDTVVLTLDDDGAVLVGGVFDANGNPVSGLDVHVAERDGSGRRLASATTDRLGRFRCEGLPAGGAVVWAVIPPDRTHLRMQILLAAGSELEVTLAASSTLTTIPISYAIVITDQSTGLPVEGARVYLERQHQGAWRNATEATTDSTGRAAGQISVADRYRAVIHGPGGELPKYVPQRVEIQPGVRGDLSLHVALSRQG